jgi:MinD-like ATPase involved in chromosome partitioning or flagellar assembly
MTRIVTFISARRGVGKSTLTANLAALLANKGHRAAMLDVNGDWSSLQTFFNLEIEKSSTFVDFLEGDCVLDAVRQPVKLPGLDDSGGCIDLIRSGIERSTASWFDSRWASQIQRMNTGYGYDFLLVDTLAGYANQDVLLLSMMSSIVLVVLRADRQDLIGTAKLLAALEALEISNVGLIANQIPESFDLGQVKSEMEQSFHVNVQAVLPLSESLLESGSTSLFVLTHSSHVITRSLQALVSGSLYSL